MSVLTALGCPSGDVILGESVECCSVAISTVVITVGSPLVLMRTELVVASFGGKVCMKCVLVIELVTTVSELMLDVISVEYSVVSILSALEYPVVSTLSTLE